ncbi:hypothetical protein [Spiroplasma endosymbiont of Dilophus febrilis]|uniref:hypothetical protein n=1 Tax=Spiroplasma endosymbiont of Dilophus febrilis TaxID=3066292 RepID=UPI00313D4FEF
MFQWLVATYDFLLKLLRNFQERKLRKEKLKQEVEATKQKKIDTKILSEKLLREQYKTFYVKEIYDTVKKQKYNEFKKIKKTMDLKKELEILIENVNGIENEVIDSERE